jgi:antitoxin MazE
MAEEIKVGAVTCSTGKPHESIPHPAVFSMGAAKILLDHVYPMAKPAPMKTTLQRWGNSQGVRLPKSIVDALGISVGTPVIVEITKDQSQITITPATESRPVRGRYRIEDLIAGSSSKAFDAETDWGKPVGKEAW